MNHSGVCIFFGNTQENFRSNLALVVVLVPESKGLQCLSGGNKLLHVRSFIILRSGEGLTSFNKNNGANFPSKKKRSPQRSGVYFQNTRQKLLVRSLPSTTRSRPRI